MYGAEISMSVLTYIGILRPNFLSKKTSAAYDVFGVSIIFFTYAFTSATVIYLLRSNPDLEEFTECLFYSLCLLAACLKVTNIFFKQEQVLKLTETFLHRQYAPRNITEWKIQDKFDKIGRAVTVNFIIFGSVTLILTSVRPLFKGFNTSLPFKVWLPYSLENKIVFWLTYLHQAIASMMATQAIIAVDTLGMAIILHICAQLEILTYRIQEFPKLCFKKGVNTSPKKQQLLLGLWIKHHNSVFVLGDMFRNIYNLVFFFQLITVTIHVCTSSYLLTTLSVTSSKFWTMILGLCSMTIESCLYCWHGEFATEKSIAVAYAVYSSDWTLLSKSAKACFIHIIGRSYKPLKFTAGFAPPMCIQTFTTILRLSYSIYSILKQSS